MIKELLYFALYFFISGAVLELGMFTAVALINITRESRRKRKVNSRIIKQAKAAGVWGDIEKMGGKALELYAWKVWLICREEGETDEHLRLRIYSRRKGQF